jgi:hypothetical protein
VSPAGEHEVVIERRGLSHRACCACGWTGHAWNELRPAEADAWHHLFGDDRVIDVAALASSVAGAAARPAWAGEGHDVAGARRRLPEPIRRLPSLESLVNRARALADSPSPYRHQAADELWRFAAEDRALLEAAVSEIGDLLWRHSRRSASTADSEWLQLITAKRLLQETMQQEDSGSSC